MTQLEPHIFFNSNIDSPDDWRKALATQFANFSFSVDGDVSRPESVDIALIWTIPDGGLERFTNLRAVLSLGAGISQIEIGRLPKNVPLTRLVDPSLARSMVDYAKAAVYRYHRRFHIFERQGRDSNWKFIPPTFTSATSVGILGLGVLGREVALQLRQEGFKVLGWSRTPKQLDGVETYTGRSGLATVVAGVNIVINILPLTDETRHILSRELFRQFADGSCLINMGRGAHVVEADLLDAIDAGKIEAATLDVASVEPLPRGHRFWNHPSILITPHVAGISDPTTAVLTVAANIRKAMAGEQLLQQVDLQRGY